MTPTPTNPATTTTPPMPAFNSLEGRRIRASIASRDRVHIHGDPSDACDGACMDEAAEAPDTTPDPDNLKTHAGWLYAILDHAKRNHRAGSEPFAGAVRWLRSEGVDTSRWEREAAR